MQPGHDEHQALPDEDSHERGRNQQYNRKIRPENARIKWRVRPSFLGRGGYLQIRDSVARGWLSTVLCETYCMAARTSTRVWSNKSTRMKPIRGYSMSTMT
jgi:hypothetical protein